jgi:hypothetical protein
VSVPAQTIEAGFGIPRFLARDGFSENGHSLLDSKDRGVDEAGRCVQLSRAPEYGHRELGLCESLQISVYHHSNEGVEVDGRSPA